MAAVNLEAAVVPITIEQGKSVEIAFAATRNGVPFDLTGFDLRLQVRQTWESPALINCTLANGKLVWIDAAAGRYRLVLQPADTSLIQGSKFSDGSLECVYDSELISVAGTVYAGSKGTFTIKREVTR